MALEGLVAFSLASNIIQFVDYSSRIVSKFKEIHRSASGATKDAVDLTIIHQQLEKICLTLSVAETPQIPEELADLAKQCAICTKELLQMLSQVRAKDPKSKWQSARAALKSAWTSKDIQAMQKKISGYRDQLILHMQTIQRTQSLTLNDIRDLNRLLKSELTEEITKARETLDNAFKGLADEVRKRQRLDQDANGAMMFGPRYQSSQSSRAGEGQLTTVADNNLLLSITQDLGNLTVSADNLRGKLKVLEDLHFNGMFFRHSHVVQAHRQTFKYMFENNFAHWLKSGEERTYWISGKPGSGKSTLMKYLVHHTETTQLLRSWAGSRTLHIAGHFFWINGSELQRSQEGLLRVILFDIFRAHPDLIPKSLLDPHLRIPSSTSIASQLTFEWNWGELEGTFKNLVEETRNTHCFCVFVDGLDEFNGNQEDLIQCIRSFSTASNVKFCIASRPWNIFEQAFGDASLRKVYLQDLNKPDIEKYVRDNLQSRPEFQLICEEEPEADTVVEEIIEKSKGVFLWTYLVVRSLISGLINDDRLMDLHKRLRDFPSDLNKFFTHILDSLDSNYQAQIVRGFQAVLCSRTILSVLNFWYMDTEEEKPGFALRMGHTAVSLEQKQQSDETKVNKMRRRINARFKGLLEVVKPVDHLDSSSSFHLVKVDFLHRTVKDFLLTTDAQNLIAKWALPESNLYHLICNSTLAEIRSMHPKGQDLSKPDLVPELVNDLFFAAREYENHANSPLTAILDGLQATIASQWTWPEPSSELSSLDYFPWTNWGSQTFLHCAIRWHLTLYVQFKVSTLEGYFDESWVAAALQNWHDHQHEPTRYQGCRTHLAMLSCLLDLRNPSKSLELTWIPKLKIAWEKEKICDRATLFLAFKLLCQRGAMDICCRDKKVLIYAIDAIPSLFSPQERAELEQTADSASVGSTSQLRKRAASLPDAGGPKKTKLQ